MDNKDSGKMLRVGRILDLGGRANSMAARLQMPFYEGWRSVESRGSMDGAYFCRHSLHGELGCQSFVESAETTGRERYVGEGKGR